MSSIDKAKNKYETYKNAGYKVSELFEENGIPVFISQDTTGFLRKHVFRSIGALVERYEGEFVEAKQVDIVSEKVEESQPKEVVAEETPKTPAKKPRTPRTKKTQ